MTDTEQKFGRGVDWRALTDAARIDLPHPVLELGIRYLRDARGVGGWGVFPGNGKAEVDRHSSALAMQAIRGRRGADAEWILNDAGLYFMNVYKDHIRGLSGGALIDVYSVLIDVLDAQPDVKVAVTKRAREVVHATIHDSSSAPVSRLASLLSYEPIAVLLTDVQRQEAFESLRESQDPNGSWHRSADVAGTLVATVAAMRALAGDTGNETDGARLRAYEFLLHLVAQRGVASLDTFSVAVLLRGLGSFNGTSFPMLDSVQRELVSRAGVDGGWSGQPGSPATVEHTALAVLALSESGAADHVPTRLLVSAMSELDHRTVRLETDNRSLRNEFEAEVEKRCGSILLDHKRIQSELIDVNARLVAATKARVELGVRQAADPVVSSAKYLEQADVQLRSRDRAVVTGLVAAASTLAAGSVAVVLLPDTAWSGSGAAAGVIIAAAGGVAASLLASFRWRARRRRELAELRESAWSQMSWDTVSTESERLRSLRLAFASITREWPRLATEEMVFRLFDEFVEIPSDIARRLGEQAVLQVGESPEEAFSFGQWAAAAALLESDDRRVLFDQIRRTVHRP